MSTQDPDRVGGRFAGHEPAAGQDTGGVPWAGRTLQPTGFEQDTGAVDPALADLLARLEGDAPDAVDTAMREVAATVAAVRLLVPVLAEPSSDGREEDMAAPTLVAEDGTRALPAFSGLAALSDWDPRARPVPVTAQRAALAAVQERCQQIVIDPVGAHLVLPSSVVWALASAREWLPAHEDPQVRRALERAVDEHRPARLGDVGAGPGGALRVVLEIPPGLAAAAVQSLVRAVGEQLASDGEVRARIDALSVAVRPLS